MKSTITFGIAFLAQQVVAFFGLGPCGMPAKCRQEIALPFFMGPWYVIQQDWISTMWNLQDLCAAYNYTLLEDERVEKIKYSNQLLTGLFTGSETVDGRSILHQSSVDQQVVLTDYENYAVVLTCTDVEGLFHYTSAKILSRTTSLEDVYVTQALAFLQDSCSYAADLDLLKTFTDECDKLSIKEFDPQTSAVSYSSGSAVISWERVPYPVTAYKLEYINTEGNWEDLFECPSADLVQMEKPSCSLSLAVIQGITTTSMSTKVRVWAYSSTYHLIVAPTPLDGYLILDIRSPKVMATGGSWTTMTLKCEDLGIDGLLYMLIKNKQSFQFCDVPCDWDSATVIGEAQTSTTFTVTTSLDDHVIACRTVTPSGNKGEVKNFIYFQNNNGPTTPIALNAQVTEASTSGVTITWDPPVDNGYRYVPQGQGFFEIAGNNRCNYLEIEYPSREPPLTFNKPLKRGQLYGIWLVAGRNNISSGVHMYFIVE